MEIKRTVEVFVETKRRFVVRQAETVAEQIACPECSAPMLAAEQIAVFFGVSRRSIYQTIERGAAHFLETGNGCLFVCPNSLAENFVTPEKKYEIS